MLCNNLFMVSCIKKAAHSQSIRYLTHLRRFELGPRQTSLFSCRQCQQSISQRQNNLLLSKFFPNSITLFSQSSIFTKHRSRHGSTTYVEDSVKPVNYYHSVEVNKVTHLKKVPHRKYSRLIRPMAGNSSTASTLSKEGQHDQNYDFLLILDFEATCDDKTKLRPQEIIEFPVLKLNTKTLQVDSTFHQYVQPQYHPQLTPFCVQLTGIIQDMVDGQQSLPQVLQDFDQWMLKEGLLDPAVRSAIVTCGDWDLKTMLPQQCDVLKLKPKPYFKSWINIKKSFAELTSRFPKGMMYMLTDLKMKHVGRHHSGIDDCTNIANIAVEVMKRGHVFKVNSELQNKATM